MRGNNMNCTIERANFNRLLGVLSAVVISFIFGSIFFVPVVFAHMLVMSLFNLSFTNSFAVGVYGTLIIFILFLPVYLYSKIKEAHQDLDYHFCDEAFYINNERFEYKNIKNVEVDSSFFQRIFNLNTLKIIAQKDQQIKCLYFRGIQEPSSLISRIACPLE
ncbi:MAG: hypothetical protein ACOYVD_01985 [Bacillota bacterium]